MIISPKTLTLSGAWLIGRAKSMARDLLKRGPRYSSKQSVLEGYLLQAKRAGNIGSCNIIDPPAFLAVSGAYSLDGLYYPDLAYIQQLSQGRDSYLPGSIKKAQAPQTDPVLFPALNTPHTIGSGGTGRRLATRFWGVAQPFTGVGFAYGYGAVYTSLANSSWALAYAREDDAFVYYIGISAPSFYRANTTKQSGSFAAQGNPGARQANWSVQISESILRESGAKAFIRRLGLPTPDYEITWDYMQYPWMSYSEPYFYTDDDGDPAFELLVVGQVVYDEAGPYYTDDTPTEYGWDPDFVGQPIASGAKGLWAAKIKFEKDTASIVSHYAINGLNSSDERRQPQILFQPADPSDPSSPQPDAYWYQNNFHYKSSPVRLNTGEYVMVDGSSVSKFDPRIGMEDGVGTTAFVDVVWFTDNGHRAQNIKTTVLPASYRTVSGEPISWSTHIYFDAGADEMRFVGGSATDGEIMVSPVFSSFRPGDSPVLHIIVADRDSASIAYTGKPGFAMLMCGLLDETAAIQYVEDPFFDPNSDGRPPRTMTIVAGDGLITYIGNGKFAFYVSSEWNTPAPTSTAGGVRGNLALAIYKRGGSVNLVSVIDPTITNFLMNTSLEGFAFTQTMFSDRVGRIEVVRQESDGYVKGERGNPATLIATRGWGAPSINYYTQSGMDVKTGTTWISYDSGETWAVLLNYGSPAGVFHCGNTLAPRSNPIVRI